MRTIREEKLYEEQIKALRVDWERLDEALSQRDQALSTIPEQFPIVPGTGNPGLRRLKLVGFPGVPPLTIFFTFTATEVNLQAAEIIEED